MNHRRQILIDLHVSFENWLFVNRRILACRRREKPDAFARNVDRFSPILLLFSFPSSCRSATSASTTYTLNHLIFFELRCRYSAYAGCVKIRFFRLDATQAAELLVSLLFPLRNEVRVGIAILEKPVIELF